MEYERDTGDGELVNFQSKKKRRGANLTGVPAHRGGGWKKVRGRVIGGAAHWCRSIRGGTRASLWYKG